MDRVLHNGKVYVERGTYAQAIWMQDDRIKQVGSNEEVLAAAPADSTLVDLGGATVIPGFNDSHLHMRSFGMSLKVVKLHNSQSMAEIIERGKRFLDEKQLPAGALLMGRGWNQDYFLDEQRMPTRHDLDKISTEHPVYYTRACGHAVTVNTKLLELAGVTADTPQPDGGQFEVGDDGQPNGIFYERANVLFADFLPQPTAETFADDFRAAMEYAASMGVTTVNSNDTNAETYEEIFKACALLRERGQFLTRYRAQCSFIDAEQLKGFFAKGYKTGWGDELVQVASIKLLLDGSLGARTALLRAPYADDESTTGIIVLEKDVFNELVRISDENNTSVVTHAIGDGAIEMALDGYDMVIKGGANKNRHGVVHVQITDTPLLQRFVDSDILALVQPIFIHYDMHMVGDRVGAEMASTSYAFGTLTRMGVHTSSGTDCPVEDMNPYECVYCAVSRRDLKGKGPYLEVERVDVETAIDNYTLESAYVSFEEDVVGRLKPGFLADLVVLDADIFTVPEEDILSIRPVATYMGGRLVYQREA